MIPFELVLIFTRLQIPETREAATRELAAFMHATDVLVFGKDEEIGVFLPALGLPQTLRQGNRWQDFLNECAGAGASTGTVPAPGGDADIIAHGITDKLGLSILVILGADPGEQMRTAVSALLPLLGAKLAVERAALAAAGHAAAARNASRRAGALNAALDTNRRELQKAYERAEQELVSRREAENKLREADRRKDEFLAMLAHELRNPLAPISMAAQILKLASIDAVRVQQASQIIERQIKHVTNLLDDLLDVSRVTRGLVALAKEPLDLKSVIADAVEQARPLIEARQHRLTVQLAHEAARVQGDRTRLVQVITNLLNNAAKYTHERGDILLRLEVEPHHVNLFVRDSGIGIDAKLLPQVFDLFVQGERTADRSQGGLGLGLALVKSLAELHGGQVAARSRGLGTGSEFAVRLPRQNGWAEQSVSQQGSSAAPGTAGQALRVMIVDDNADAAQTMAIFLVAMGHEVRISNNAKSALDMLGDETPHVFLLDIGLPDMDGYQLARILKSRLRKGDAVLIALTGYGQPEDRERSKAAGFDYHLTKPADVSALTKLLSEISQQFIAGYSQSAI